MSSVIVPVGFGRGWHHRFDPPPAGEPSCTFDVNLGRRVEHLDREPGSTWLAAHDDLPAQLAGEADRKALVRRLKRGDDPPTDAKVCVDMLLDDGLLVEYDPRRDLEPFLRRYRLRPTGTGIGNLADEPDRYLIAGNGIRLETEWTVGKLWWSGYRAHSLWQACLAYAFGARDDLSPDERHLALTGTDVADDLVAALPGLLSARCAFLEPVEE